MLHRTIPVILALFCSVTTSGQTNPISDQIGRLEELVEAKRAENRLRAKERLGAMNATDQQLVLDAQQRLRDNPMDLTGRDIELIIRLGLWENDELLSRHYITIADRHNLDQIFTDGIKREQAIVDDHLARENDEFTEAKPQPSDGTASLSANDRTVIEETIERL